MLPAGNTADTLVGFCVNGPPAMLSTWMRCFLSEVLSR